MDEQVHISELVSDKRVLELERSLEHAVRAGTDRGDTLCDLLRLVREVRERRGIVIPPRTPCGKPCYGGVPCTLLAGHEGRCFL